MGKEKRAWGKGRWVSRNLWDGVGLENALSFTFPRSLGFAAFSNTSHANSFESSFPLPCRLLGVFARVEMPISLSYLSRGRSGWWERKLWVRKSCGNGGISKSSSSFSHAGRVGGWGAWVFADASHSYCFYELLPLPCHCLIPWVYYYYYFSFLLVQFPLCFLSDFILFYFFPLINWFVRFSVVNFWDWIVNRP